MKNLSLNSLCSYSNSHGIWFIHSYFPILLFFDFSQNKITFCKIISDVENYHLLLFNDIYEYKDKIIILSKMNNIMIIYDKKRDCFSNVKSIKEQNKIFNQSFDKQNLASCIFYQQDRNILKLEMETLNIIEMVKLKHPSLCMQINVGENIFFTEKESNIIVIYNLRDNKWTEKEIGNSDNKFHRIIHLDQCFILFDKQKKKLYKYTLDFKYLISEINLEENEFMMNSVGNYLIIDSEKNDNWFVYNESLQLINQGKYHYQQTNHSLTNMIKLGTWTYSNEQLYCIDPYNHLLIFDQNMESIQIDLRFSEYQLNELKKSFQKNEPQQIFFENDWLSIDSWLTSIEKKVSNNGSASDYGKKIYEKFI